jgi:hypothetical protein
MSTRPSGFNGPCAKGLVVMESSFSIPVHRVFFDTNTGTHEAGYILEFDLSKEDLDKIGRDLRNGLEVILYMPDELNVRAVLSYDEELGCWRGLPIGDYIDH